MTNENNQDNQLPSPSGNWFKHLIERLPLKKLTRAQAGNYLMDALGAICFFVYIGTNPPAGYCLIALILIVLLFAWCHAISRPRSSG